MDFRPHIERFRRRFAEVEASLSDPKAFDNPQRAQELAKEYARLKELVAAGESFLKTLAELEENRALVKSEPAESEMALMAKEEVARLETQEAKFAEALQFGLVPPDPTDSRNTIVEIRAGAGGSESALFAADLFRMYHRYAEARGWKVEPLDSNPSDLGGFKEIVFEITGSDVFKRMKYESGVHRVQRVPATEAQGRIHTSTATVAVLPEAEEVDIEIKPDEVEINCCRASGKGGQGVNTTDSAVRLTHIPTNIVVVCQNERSQIKNRASAMNVLKARLYEKKLDEQRSEMEKFYGEKGEIGFGSQIRSYVLQPYQMVKDLRTGVSTSDTQAVLDGDLDRFIYGWLRAGCPRHRNKDIQMDD
jgi:peptide chain release factor 1